jgi:hypothetical protein
MKMKTKSKAMPAAVESLATTTNETEQDITVADVLGEPDDRWATRNAEDAVEAATKTAREEAFTNLNRAAKSRLVSDLHHFFDDLKNRRDRWEEYWKTEVAVAQERLDNIERLHGKNLVRAAIDIAAKEFRLANEDDWGNIYPDGLKTTTFTLVGWKAIHANDRFFNFERYL